MYNSDFNRYLQTNEEILWTGVPIKKLITREDIIFIPFAAFFLLFSIFWISTALLMGAPFIFPIFGIPFVLVGFYMLFGRFVGKANRFNNTFYAVTNKRVLILTKGNRGSFNGIELDKIRNIQIIDDNGDTGTIIFDQNDSCHHYDHDYYSYNNHGRTMQYWGCNNNSFYNISGVDRVYRLVIETKEMLEKKKEI